MLEPEIAPTGTPESRASELMADVRQSARECWDWTRDNVVKPAYNTAAVQPLNTVSSLVNEASHKQGGNSLLPELKEESVAPAATFSAAWFAQNISSGLAASVVYSVAGKVAGGSMRCAGRALELEGAGARLAANEHLAQIAGAAGYDGLRKPGENETRLGNMAGGALNFYLIGKGQGISEPLGLSGKLLTRIGTGAIAATAQLAVSDLVSRHKLSEGRSYLDAALTGSAMNLVLPAVQEHLSTGIDRFNAATGRGIALDRFVAREGLSGRSWKLDYLIRENALARVQPDAAENRIDHKRDIVYLKGNDPAKLGHELEHRLNHKEYETNFEAAADLVKVGQTQAAWAMYKQTRLAQETEARQAEHDIARHISNSGYAEEGKADVARMPELLPALYEQQWRKEFEQFQETKGEYRPEKDNSVEEKYGITYDAMARRTTIGSCDLTDNELRDFLGHHPDIRVLEFSNCPNLASLPLEGLSNLQDLWVYNCPNLAGTSLEGLSELQRLDVYNCPNLASLPLEGLSNLRELCVFECPNLASVPLEGLSNLRELRVSNCPNLASLPLQGLSNLQSMGINNCPNLASLGDQLPDGLKSLYVVNQQNLVKLPEQLPIGLTYLQLDHCPALQELPKNLPPDLQIQIDGCPVLESNPNASKLLSKQLGAGAKERQWSSDQVKITADMLRGAADAITKLVPETGTCVLLGRDAYPLVPLLRYRGVDARYFLWSRLQIGDQTTASLWKKEVPANSIVIDTGYAGSILNDIEKTDPTIKGYLMSSTGAYPEIPGLQLDRGKLVRYVERFPKSIGRGEKISNGGVPVCKVDKRDVEEQVFSPKKSVELTKQLLVEMGLPEEVAERHKTFSGLSKEERLGVGKYFIAGGGDAEDTDLPNFGRVHGFLYRGGQPTEAGLRKLRSLGVDTIIDLRTGDTVEQEAQAAQALGMRHVHLPIDGDGYPATEQIDVFMNEVRGAAGNWSKAMNGGGDVTKPAIYVHCAKGADRTGCMIGAARVALDAWTYEEAQREMKKYHFNSKQTQLAEIVKERADNQNRAGSGSSNQNGESLQQILLSGWQSSR